MNIPSILALLYLFGDILNRVVPACMDSGRYNINMGTALHINILLEDCLRNLLYDEARGTPQPADILQHPADLPHVICGADAEMRDLAPVQPQVQAVENHPLWSPLSRGEVWG